MFVISIFSNKKRLAKVRIFHMFTKFRKWIIILAEYIKKRRFTGAKLRFVSSTLRFSEKRIVNNYSTCVKSNR